VAAAALRQAGILRAGSIRESIAIAQGLVLGAMSGKRLLIASRSGGHAVIAADAAVDGSSRFLRFPRSLAPAFAPSILPT